MSTPNESKHQVISATAKAVRLYAPILENFGAPKLAQLTECNAPDVPEWQNHLATTILNSVFLGIEFEPLIQRYLLNFMRRMETAVSEYRLGRATLQSYVDELPKRNNHFLSALRALSHFEQSAAALYQAAMLTEPVTKQKPFQKGDKSPMERLNMIYNRSKHFEEGVRQQAMPPATPVWLINEGLECSLGTLSFADFHEIILDLTKCAEAIAVELPKLIEERRKAADQTKKV